MTKIEQARQRYKQEWNDFLIKQKITDPKIIKELENQNKRQIIHFFVSTNIKNNKDTKALNNIDKLLKLIFANIQELTPFQIKQLLRRHKYIEEDYLNKNQWYRLTSYYNFKKASIWFELTIEYLDYIDYEAFKQINEYLKVNSVPKEFESKSPLYARYNPNPEKVDFTKNWEKECQNDYFANLDLKLVEKQIQDYVKTNKGVKND
ncbi:hypothetical protein GE118_00380 [Mycoplasma sp. NEAQ87857]|uniref:hypothetical protein n=1 Tax=Mycoplasma sp. NEAQ87857 TaxID=2683967 RepID=UPI0013197653|nr:hypothetical protein [Mycoplasma sp. NEAQ87857]QGZ97260.1 hypothetical protein GE118_00380 [Mycoplasma sp. NEAQ87857]